MKKFMVLSYMTAEVLEDMEKKSPENMKEIMDLWFAWKAKYNEQVIDMGSPLLGGVKVWKDGSTQVSEKGLVGYMMVGADSLEEAIKILQDSPLFDYAEGFEIEVQEIQSM